MVISKNSLWIYLNIINTIQYLSHCDTNIMCQKYLYFILITRRKWFLLHLKWALFLTSLTKKKNVCLTITIFPFLTWYKMYKLRREKIKTELMLFSCELNYLALLYFQGTYLLIYFMKSLKKWGVKREVSNYPYTFVVVSWNSWNIRKVFPFQI